MVKTENKNQDSSSSESKKKNNKYKGVRMRSWGSYVSEIRAPNQKTRIWLGSYSNPESAARAYDAALLCLKGPSATLNFPLPISSLQYLNHIDKNTLMTPKSIQKLAALAAHDTNFLQNAKNMFTASPQSPVYNTPCSVDSEAFNDSTSASSASPVSSIDDDLISLAAMQSDDDYVVQFDDFSRASECSMGPWYNFDSPKYNDMMLTNGAFYDPMMGEDACEDGGDIRLWSFC